MPRSDIFSPYTYYDPGESSLEEGRGQRGGEVEGEHEEEEEDHHHHHHHQYTLNHDHISDRSQPPPLPLLTGTRAERFRQHFNHGRHSVWSPEEWTRLASMHHHHLNAMSRFIQQVHTYPNYEDEPID